MSTSESRFDPSLLPAVRQFYEAELGKLSRPSRSWARTACPFHGGTNRTAFSVNLDRGGFYCFSCGVKGGDIVDFVMQRDKLDFKRAAQLLGAWRNEIEPGELQHLRLAQQERKRRWKEKAGREQRERQERLRVREELHTDMQLLRHISTNLAEDPGNEQLWCCLQLAWESEQLSDQHYRETAGLEAHER